MALEFLDADVDAGSEVGEEKADGSVTLLDFANIGGWTQEP